MRGTVPVGDLTATTLMLDTQNFRVWRPCPNVEMGILLH
jgi:hypothetical protein